MNDPIIDALIIFIAGMAIGWMLGFTKSMKVDLTDLHKKMTVPEVIKRANEESKKLRR